MRQWFGQAVIDLAGLEIPDRAVGLLLNHGFDRSAKNPRMGVCEKIEKNAEGLVVEGRMLTHDDAARLVADAKERYPFEMSVYAEVLEKKELRAGESASVNGRAIAGPCVIATRSALREVTVCDLGADRNTRFAIAASAMMDPECEDENMEDHKDPIDETTPEVAGKPTDDAKDTKASIARLRARLGERDALILKGVEEGWDDVRACEALIADQNREIESRNAEIVALKARLKAASDGGLLPVVAGSGPDPSRQAAPSADGAMTFRGAAGTNPAADWQSSEELRKHWDGKRSAFMAFAANQQRDGESYLVNARLE